MKKKKKQKTYSRGYTPASAVENIVRLYEAFNLGKPDKETEAHPIWIKHEPTS